QSGKVPGHDPADLFTDLSRLRLSQDFAATCGVKKALLTIPVRKPAKEWFIRTNPALHIDTYVLELKEDRETYLVDPKLWSELSSESTFGRRAVFAGLNRQNVFFVWPIRLPGGDGKLDDGTAPRSRLHQWPRHDGFGLPQICL